MDESRLSAILEGFRARKILVVGDFYLDAYWLIDKTRSTLSLETPWHTHPVVNQRYSPGAAGTVTNNLKALEVGEVYTLGVVGCDGFGTTLLECLEANGCITDFMIQSPDRVTPTYLKPIHHGYEEIQVEGPRFDIENLSSTSSQVEDAVINALHTCVPMVEGVIVGDQMPIDNWGVVTDRVRAELCRLAVEFPEKVFYADSRTRIGKYQNVIIKPNRFEARRAVEPDWEGGSVDLELAKACALRLAELMQKVVYVTVGEQGILICHKGQIEYVPGIEIDGATDPVGAGDSVSSGIVSTLCGVSPEMRDDWRAHVEAAQVGNLVASITVTKIGTTGTASHGEVIERLRSVS
jgi:rfaE bifunctional protein kinase chain/domain